MITLIENNKQPLFDICRKHHVRRLDLVGSATSDDFESTRSDLDFLVEFDSSVGNQRFDNYFALQQALQQLFDTSVDLIEPGGLRNPYLIRRIEESRTLLYDAT